MPAWAPIGQYAEWYRAHLDGGAKDVLLHPSPMVETIAHHLDRWAHVERFDDFVEFLTFDEYDPDAWAQLALDAGMTYTVMVAKHHDGLCWWDAPDTERTVLHAGPRRNVLGEYAAACERAHLPLGTYYSLLDWSDTRYPSCLYVDNVVHPHVLDLVNRYGSKMLWGDGHWGGGGSHWRSDDLIAEARRIDPSIVVNDRWWADGPGVRSFEYRLPSDIHDGPWEMRRGLGSSFGYNRAESAEHLLTPDGIVALLTEVVAKGGHLLLSVGPDARGAIPSEHADLLRLAGTWVRAHQSLVDRGVPWHTWGDGGARYIVLDGGLHAVDVGGHGKFDALSRPTGRVVAVARVDADGTERPVEFEQDDRGLRLALRSRHSTGHDAAAVRTAVYRIELEPAPPPPVELFVTEPPEPIELAAVLAGATAGQIVQLGDGTYIGPVRVPDGVTVRGLGPARTVLDGLESIAIALGRNSRVEHCTIRGGGQPIAWLPKVVARLAGLHGVLLGCRVHGHVEVADADCRITSCTVSGVLARGVDRVTVTRCTSTGMSWDCAIDIEGGTGHVVESCDITQVLEAIRLTKTIGAEIRGNRVSARWWGVRAIDTEATEVAANSFEHTMRAVDVDGGTLAEVTGNAVLDGDSGCVVQRGASDVMVAGNHWERLRIGLLAWDAGFVRHHDNTVVDVADAPVTIGP